ncbi:MAG: MaoC family dehydratase [Bellilinea sp.]
MTENFPTPLNDRNFAPGNRASFSKTITEADVTTMAGVTGDFDPLHIDAEYARQTRYGRRTAHPLLATGLLATVLHTRLPGPGTVCLSQQIEFLGPIFIGDTITAQVEVVAFQPEKHLITLKTTCSNQDARQVLTGQAVLMFLKEVAS